MVVELLPAILNTEYHVTQSPHLNSGVDLSTCNCCGVSGVQLIAPPAAGASTAVAVNPCLCCPSSRCPPSVERVVFVQFLNLLALQEGQRERIPMCKDLLIGWDGSARRGAPCGIGACVFGGVERCSITSENGTVRFRGERGDALRKNKPSDASVKLCIYISIGVQVLFDLDVQEANNGNGLGDEDLKLHSSFAHLCRHP